MLAQHPCTLRILGAPGIPLEAPWEPLESPLGAQSRHSSSHICQSITYTWAALPLLPAHAEPDLHNGSPGHGHIGRGINAFPLFFSLYHSAQGEIFQGLTYLPVSLPQPSALHHCLPSPGRTEGSVLPVAQTDRGTGRAALGELHARTGKCCAAGSAMQTPKSWAGGSCCEVAAGGGGVGIVGIVPSRLQALVSSPEARG